MPPVLLPGCPGHSFLMTFITGTVTLFSSVTFPRSWVSLPFDEPQPVPDISDYHYCALAMEWSHCSVYKDMRIFTYSTSAISRQWFHSGKSQWGATAAPALRVQLDGLTSSAGTLCGQTHCPALRWGGEGSSSGLNPNPALSTFDLLSSLKCGNYISCLNRSALEGRLGLPDSWSQWDSLGAIQHKQAEDSECRGEELGWERAGWRLTDSAGAVMRASMILHDVECDAQDCLCVCGTPHPAFTVMGELR